METAQDRFRFVLARPAESGNVGFSCRAMKTMGFTNLVIAGGEGLDPDAVRIFAVHAYDVFERASLVPTLREALAGCSFAAGVTRRRGQKRKRYSFLPEEFAEKAAAFPDGEIAVVFGNERTGLDSEELSLCHVAVNIPSSPLFPSLNLSHAVQVITYQLSRTLSVNARGGKRPSGFVPVPMEDIGKLADGICANLKAIGFYKQGNPEDMSLVFRDVFARSGLSKGEFDYIARIFQKIEYLKTR
jgi:TrmH family RNA methyltransferase